MPAVNALLMYDQMLRAGGKVGQIIKALFDMTWKIPDVEKVDSARSYAFNRGFPSSQEARRTRDDADFQRTMIAYRFWYPTVSTEGIFDGARSLGIEDGKGLSIAAAGPRQMAFTANSDTPYGSGSAQFETSNGLDLEARDRWFAQAIVTSPAMFNRAAGAGSLYRLAARDSTGALSSIVARRTSLRSRSPYRESYSGRSRL